MNVHRAVITAAARDQRALPLQTLIDRDGVEKKALGIILDEVIEAGIDEVAVVVCPGDQAAYAEAAGDHAGRLVFLEQPQPLGYGHALWLARDFTGSGPFLHLVGDHLYVSRGPVRCAQQVVERATAEGVSVSAVQPTRENLLPYYGTVGGRRVARHTDLYEVEDVVEKPTPSQAEQTLLVPGLRAGYYLCLFGIHVFTPAVMELLGEEVASGRRPVQLSSALAGLARRERYLALEVPGVRYNIGIRYGLFLAQLALALDGKDRETVLAQLVEQLAVRSAREG
ncbi:MAG: sugar phosphate nucleotidyltransferase [Gemmataceae bacterium]